MGEAKHIARVNEMEGEQIDIQGYATELILSYPLRETDKSL